MGSCMQEESRDSILSLLSRCVMINCSRAKQETHHQPAHGLPLLPCLVVICCWNYACLMELRLLDGMPFLQRFVSVQQQQQGFY